ncbi:MAG: S-layer homology domain-containing protein [Microcoleaceae cyanobacterium]
MTQSPPPESSSQVSPESARRIHDEWIAVVVALLALGSIFFWIVGRQQIGRQFGLSSSDTTADVDLEDGDRTSRLSLSREIDDSLSSRPEADRREPLTQTSITPRPTVNPGLATAAAGSAVVAQDVVERPTVNQSVATQPEATATPTETPTETPEATATPTETPEVAASPTETPTEDPAETPEATASPTEAPSVVAFTDVPDDYWAKDFINVMNERQVKIGDPTPEGVYKPDQPITRGELAAAIQDAFGLEGEQAAAEYIDVPEGYEEEQAIETVTKAGFMSGYPDDSFDPRDEVPRLEALVALASGLNLQLPDNPEQVLQTYQDADQVPDWADPKIAAATQSGLVVSHPDTSALNPKQSATRAEVAAMLHQALLESGQVQEKIESEYIVQPTQ